MELDMERKTLLATCFLTTLVAIALVCFARHQEAIETDLATRARDAVVTAGFADVRVSSSGGRDVRLDGGVADSGEGQRAVESVRAVSGVRRVHDRLRIQSPLEFDGLEVSVRGGEIVLIGDVADEMTRNGLVALARERFNPMVVLDRLEIDPRAEASRARLGALLIESFDPRIVPGALQLSGDELLVSGRVGSDQRRTDYGRRLEELFVGTTVLNRLEVSVQPALDDVLALRRVEFAPGSSRLTARGRRTLDEVAVVLERWPDVRIDIVGHTDATGDPAFNLELSQSRAEVARDYLAERLPGERFSVFGIGAERPLASNETTEGRLRNRRIEFRVDEENVR
jgi:OOP family OmpA-OmpF porin